MIRTEVKNRDGIGARVWLRSVVKTVQQGLVNAGHPMKVDGRFGKGTRKAGKVFQRKNKLEDNGVFDRIVWKALKDFLPSQDNDVGLLLPKFNGDLDWVHQQEGHRGKPYWPGGISGITLDPGIDLGHSNPEFIEALYAPLITAKQLRALRKIFGFKGLDARDALKSATTVNAIRITSDQGIALMPYTAKPYWNGIRQRFPILSRKSTPASIQTVLLSLAYNRGILNRHLEPLGNLLADRNWSGVAENIGGMQQSHKLKGIRVRRRQEKLVVEAELEFLK